MIRTDTGEKIELHKHNVKFADPTKEIIVDASSVIYWIDSDKIAYIGSTGKDSKAKNNILFLVPVTLIW